MSELRTFVMWSLIFILCLMILAMTVYLADSLFKLPKYLEELGQSTVKPDVYLAKGDDDGFPYTVSYDGKTVLVKNASDTEVYSFTLTGYTLPESERLLLEKGITFKSMDDVWALIESYTS